MSEPQYKIQIRESYVPNSPQTGYNLLGQSHISIILINDHGAIVDRINGFPVDNSGNPLTVANPNVSRLFGYNTSSALATAAGVSNITNQSYIDTSNALTKTFVFNESDALSRWYAGLKTLSQIDQSGVKYNYPPFLTSAGHNSNSVAFDVTTSMALVNLDTFFQSGTPGSSNHILPNIYVNPQFQNYSTVYISLPNASPVQLTGGATAKPNQDGAYTVTTPSGQVYTITENAGGSRDNPYATITTSTGGIVARFDPYIVTSINGVGSGLDLYTAQGPILSLLQNGAIGYLPDGNSITAGAGSTVSVGTNGILVESSSGALSSISYEQSASSPVIQQPIYGGLADLGSISSDQTAANSLQTDTNTKVGLVTPSGAGQNTNLTSVAVINLGQQPTGTNPFVTDPMGFVPGGQAIAGPDFLALFPTVNNDGLPYNGPSSILTGFYRPGAQQLLPSQSNVADVLQPFTGGTGTVANLFNLAPLGDQANTSNTYLNVDPLVLDLTGNGIGLTNWINNSVYFDTNVGANGAADGKQHHTSWTNPGTGILALDANGNGRIDDITETVSEFFRGGSYATGFAALASMAQAGATAFNAGTSLIDPKTGKSYFSELVVWQDANQDGVSQPGELQTLAQLGIMSIGLTPTPNVGEAIQGSSVTGRATFTNASGTVGQVASVQLQTDTTGDIAVGSDGGVTITSTPEGGASASNSFVDKNAAAHSYSLSGGTLTDQTTGVNLGGGFKAAFATTQNDTITVNASDTGNYWLGGGSGAATLNGGAGTTVFLINHNTVVHGGTGLNIAQVSDSAPITVDLKKSNLQEVIGGAGDGIFNASGTNWNVFIQGGAGNNIIIGGAANAALAGGTGDDLIEAGTGGSVIRAGAGNDVIYGGSGSINGSKGLPADINAGNTTDVSYVERLYFGALQRESDTSGINAWTNYLASGHSRTDLAGVFLGVPPGVALYGGTSNAVFVAKIFQNMLGRPPSASESANFTQALTAGVSRASELAQLTDNPASLAYLGGQHPGASDIIYGGPGHDTVVVGANNTVVNAGRGSMTVIGKPGSFSVVRLHGSYADYTLAANADGSRTITDKVTGRDGVVTFKDVSAFDFSDIAQVSTTNSLGLPVNDSLSTSNPNQVTVSGGSYIVQAATLLANDLDYAGRKLSIREIVDNAGVGHGVGSAAVVAGGTATLNANATITFTPTSGYTGIDSFRYHVVDSAGQNGTIVNQIGTTATAEITATAYLNTPNLPTDPLLDSEWFLQAANVLPVWKDYTGKGVSVGIIDPSGNVDFSNPDLAQNAGQSYKIDTSPGIDHIGTHATLIAGVIGAAANGVSGVGVAPDATISSEVTGIGQGVVELTAVKDWRYYDVVNNSWGNRALFRENATVDTQIAQAYADATLYGRRGLGTAIVFAGGNSRAAGDNTNYHLESNSRFAINVGGINAASDLGALQISGAPFSNPGSSILVSAPANNITSTGVTFTNRYGQQFGADTQIAQGTSFAAPVVTGVVALMLQANPNLGYRDIQQILAYSATQVAATDGSWAYNNATDWNGGGLHTSENYGFGEVDARAAVRLAETWNHQSYAGNEYDVPATIGLTTTHPGGTAVNHAIPTDQGSAATPGFPITIPTTTAVKVEHASVELNLIGVNPNALIVRLVSPTGIVSTLVNQPPAALNSTNGPTNVDFVFDSTRNFGETAVGNWKVEVAYAPGVNPVGSVAGVALDLYGSSTKAASGQYVGSTYIYTDEFATVPGTNRTSLSDAASSQTPDTINVAATTGAVSINLNQGATSAIDGRALTIASGTYVNNVYLGDGTSTVVANSQLDNIYAGRGNVNITGGAGGDVVYANGGGGLLVFNGALARNAIAFTKLKAGVVVSLASGSYSVGSGVSSVTNVQELYGSSYDDTLAGNSSDNLLYGHLGNDTLIGNGGSDEYGFVTDGLGENVQISNGVSTDNVVRGQLDIGGPSVVAKAKNLWFSRLGNDLRVQLMGTPNTAVVKDWFAGGAYRQLSYILASDNRVLANANVGDLVASMASYAASHPGFDPSSASNPAVTDPTVQAAIDRDWGTAPGPQFAQPGASRTSRAAAHVGIREAREILHPVAGAGTAAGAKSIARNAQTFSDVTPVVSATLGKLSATSRNALASIPPLLIGANHKENASPSRHLPVPPTAGAIDNVAGSPVSGKAEANASAKAIDTKPGDLKLTAASTVQSQTGGSAPAQRDIDTASDQDHLAADSALDLLPTLSRSRVTRDVRIASAPSLDWLGRPGLSDRAIGSSQSVSTNLLGIETKLQKLLSAMASFHSGDDLGASDGRSLTRPAHDPRPITLAPAMA